MSNRLANEASPYLLQHKDNPVDWYPWSDEAFEKSRIEDKPVFLSIGYSTCHWCHVMEHESFEDPEVAELMNDAFISIKVDREERPDIDNIYMSVCQLMGRHCGWPLNVVLTPNMRPFFVGTYFPRETRGGRIGMLDLVPSIARAWKEDREKIEQSAENVTSALSSTAKIESGSLDPDWLRQGFSQLTSSFDRVNGGFGGSPKFPSPHNLLFLLRHAAHTGSKVAVDMVTTTLDRMMTGGIHDHVGGGFHRYSTDAEWRLPHFEKMLYDQALLIMAYSEAFQVTGFQRYEDTVRNIVRYVTRDLKASNGLFYAAEDADSEGVEGKFYVWSLEEFTEVANNADLTEAFDIRGTGNFHDEASRKLTGENVLYATKPDHAFSPDETLYTDEERQVLQRLYDRRRTRIRPGLDTKILVDWNALMVAALAIAGRVLNDAGLIETAQTAGNALYTTYRDEGRLGHLHESPRNVPGMIDDYASTLWAFIELYQSTFKFDWMTAANDLGRKMIDLFEDDNEGGFFFSPRDSETLIVRSKEYNDGAIPSGNAIACYNLQRMFRLTGDSAWTGTAERTARSAAQLVGRYPSAFTAMLMAVQQLKLSGKEVVVVDEKGPLANAMRDMIRTTYEPSTVYHIVPNTGNADRQVPSALGYVAELARTVDQPAVFICENFTCRLPITDLDALQDEYGM